MLVSSVECTRSSRVTDDRDRQAEEDYRSPLSPRLYEEAYKIEKTEQCQQLDRMVAKETVKER